MGLGVIEFLVNKSAALKDELGQAPSTISLSILTKAAGVRRPQMPRGYRGEVAQHLAKLGSTPLDKSGGNVVSSAMGVGRDATLTSHCCHCPA
jgi:hypothetical protein